MKTFKTFFILSLVLLSSCCAFRQRKEPKQVNRKTPKALVSTVRKYLELVLDGEDPKGYCLVSSERIIYNCLSKELREKIPWSFFWLKIDDVLEENDELVDLLLDAKIKKIKFLEKDKKGNYKKAIIRLVLDDKYRDFILIKEDFEWKLDLTAKEKKDIDKAKEKENEIQK